MPNKAQSAQAALLKGKQDALHESILPLDKGTVNSLFAGFASEPEYLQELLRSALRAERLLETIAAHLGTIASSVPPPKRGPGRPRKDA